VGSCTIQPNEYDDVDEDTGDVDDSKKGAASLPVASMIEGEEKRGGIKARAVVFCMTRSGVRAELYASAGSSKVLAPCELHTKCSEAVNSTPTVVNSPEPAVYILTIVPCRINPVCLKCCAYRLLYCNIAMMPDRGTSCNPYTPPELLSSLTTLHVSQVVLPPSPS